MRKYLLGISLAAIVAVTAGCGGEDHAPETDAGHGEASTSAHSDGQTEHNAQDMAFAQAMIPHHQQAVDMSTMATERATDPKVKDLATRIGGAQDPEIKQMTGMLDRWTASMKGQPSTSGTPGMDHGMDHGGMSGPGMMTGQEMQQLEKASGAAFDRMWVEMMIRHHQGAVDMANTELEKGSNAEAKALAQQIIDTQEAEIKEMQAMSS